MATIQNDDGSGKVFSFSSLTAGRRRGAPLINTGLQPGESARKAPVAVSTASTNSGKPLKRLSPLRSSYTGLKPGVNEKSGTEFEGSGFSGHALRKRLCAGMACSLAVFAMALSNTQAAAAPEPLLDSWFTVNADKPAQIYRSDADKLAGKTSTTWDNGRLGQSTPAYDGVQAVLSSSNWVYICSSGLGSHVMGPWYIDPQHRITFPNLPTDQHFILRLPRHPTVQTGNGFNPLGEIGMFVDGVRMFDANDAFSYSNQNGRDADPRARIGQGDHIWNRDAYVNEGITFDAGLGHQQNRGTYHYHSEPLALRYLLGDHVDYNPATKTYHESTTAPNHHSPILGWMQDGYPLYGPYGYSNPKDSKSPVRRMVSGYVLRNGSQGADNLSATGRHSLPSWAVRVIGGPVKLETYEYGPNISANYPLGHYMEDYAYLGDLGKTQCKEFDLDEVNGRWCVTPEFPQGTYAYFTTIDAQGKPVYPYNMGRRYHGTPAGRLVRSITEPVTTNFVAHAFLAAKSPATSDTVRLMWDGRSGGGDYRPSPK